MKGLQIVSVLCHVASDRDRVQARLFFGIRSPCTAQASVQQGI